MPGVPALARFHKLVDDISRLYLDARRVQVRFAWPVGSLREETGRRIVEEEQDGAMRAQYGTGLLLQLSKTLSEKYGAGFSKSNLLKMRRFYLLNQKESVTTQLDWTDYVELLPVKDEKTRQRLERRILKEDLNSSQIRRLVRAIRREPSAEGDRAKRYVEKFLPAGCTIVVKSHKSKTDIHGRFVVDVFYRKGAADAREIIKDGTYLNQELLDKGHAVRMAE